MFCYVLFAQSFQNAFSTLLLFNLKCCPLHFIFSLKYSLLIGMLPISRTWRWFIKMKNTYGNAVYHPHHKTVLLSLCSHLFFKWICINCIFFLSSYLYCHMVWQLCIINWFHSCRTHWTNKTERQICSVDIVSKHVFYHGAIKYTFITFVLFSSFCYCEII